MRNIIILFITILFSGPVLLSQTIYNLQFGSTGNRVELTVANSSTVSAQQVNVAVDSCPSWIKMKNVEIAVGEIPPGEEKVFPFIFDVDKTAPVGEEAVVKFIITTGINETWSKEIKVKAGAPDKYELFQNYPNPFNPFTIISYQLQYDSRVTLKVYDILGREVITLLNVEKKAGYYQEKFDAGRLGSGVYIYRLIAQSTESTPYRFGTVKKMMVIK